MKFARKKGGDPVIPSASMSDIVFTLLLFFMVATVIKKFEGLKVQEPEAYKIEKLASKTHTSYIWIDRAKNVMFDDRPISSMDELYTIARLKIEADVQLLVFLRIDKESEMGLLTDVQQELRKAGCLRIYYGTKTRPSANY
jgi:biopolymer transport protein ExbD